jgi:GNAT superfamily N-acetyltransferase
MITVRPFTTNDVAFGMRLKAAAGWNQTEADWRRTLELEPTGCFVGACDGIDAATLTTAVFGDVAWIAMVLTDPAFRGRGLATALMKHAIAYLEDRGVRSMRLDATALGKPVYEKFGFRVVTEETRYFGAPIIDPDRQEVGLRSLLPLPIEQVASAGRIDSQATGNDRTRLLSLIARDWPQLAWVWLNVDRATGFLLARRGSRAAQLGPCVAESADSGRWMMSLGLNALAGQPVYVDVPFANVGANELVRQRGLAIERTFFRMTCGDDVQEREQEIWANYGPELG